MAVTRPLPDELLARAESAHRAGDHQLALRILAGLKATGQPVRGADRLRSACFAALGDSASAEQARREDLRWFGALDADTTPICPSTASDDEWFAWARQTIEPFTMLSTRRLASLHRLAKAAARCGRAGDFVECGVAAGGSSALLAACARRYGGPGRRVWCFDTFTGMPPPTAEDCDRSGVTADDSGWGQGTCSAPMACVRQAASLLGAEDRLVVRPGLFQTTLPAAAAEIGSIAVLHLDGDWYESTRVCLEHLWDRVPPGGAIQIDDYGHWEGCRRAVDEFLCSRGLRLEFERIDYTGVALTKPTETPS